MQVFSKKLVNIVQIYHCFNGRKALAKLFFFVEYYRIMTFKNPKVIPLCKK